ncbi:MAG: type II toxin-antitoxin system RelE/ParE family toxin, partial [Betaproteobacteria bacterium]|nr:type II toxin-antitoxin system RelE/ParE family toxin [Betaproteobacteria bacterium]
AAIELGDAIERRVAELPEHPRLYRVGRVRGTREMVVHPNYVVVYRIARGEIEILRVLHSARQWPPDR